MRKSQQMRALEAALRKPIERIVADAYTEHQTIDAAAAALSIASGVPVNRSSFAYWLVRLPITIERRNVASVATAREGAAVA